MQLHIVQVVALCQVVVVSHLLERPPRTGRRSLLVGCVWTLHWLMTASRSTDPSYDEDSHARIAAAADCTSDARTHNRHHSSRPACCEAELANR